MVCGSGSSIDGIVAIYGSGIWAFLLGGVYAAVGYIGFNVMVGVWLFREITRAPMMDD